ncbi:MAG: hypothetical protein KF716_08715 [Anaerolineae bacterium]|nr:hypothetical protein [Anaerolineae bacterium]
MITHPVNERAPAQIGGARTLMLAQASARRAFTEMYRQLAGEIGGLALAFALSPDAPIPAARSQQFVAAAGQVATRYFVGSDGRSPFGTDGVTPLANYPRILNEALYTATKLPVVAQAKWLKRHLPEDIFAWMAGAKRKSLQESRVAEDLNDEIRKFYEKYRFWYVFHPNPLAQHEHSHRWVDPNGYTLSDRIWRAGTATRTKLDAMLTDAIRNGASASDLAKMVEAYLVPGRLGKRTNRPYGRDASYDGMRLARTEISRAHNYASYAASAVNPYVRGIDFKLSISHPRMDICDDKATIGMTGERLKDPYPVNAAVLAPIHPHCLCVNMPALIDDTAEITAQLREAIQESRRLNLEPHMNAADADAFTRMLFGLYLNF